MCPYLDSSRIATVKVTVEFPHSKNLFLGHNFFLSCWIRLMLSMTQGWVMILTHGGVSKVKVTVHTLLLTAILDLDNISYNCCPLPKGVSWPWLEVISPRYTCRSQFTHSRNIFLIHNFSHVTWMGMIIHTTVVHDQNVCHLSGCKFSQVINQGPCTGHRSIIAILQFSITWKVHKIM